MNFAFKSLINLSFVFVLLFQNLSWAAGVQGTLSPHALASVETFLKNFNALSDTEKQEEIMALLRQRPEADRAFIHSNIGDLKKLKFPELKYSNGKISFSVEDRHITFSLKGDNLIEVNGKTLDYGPGKFEQASAEFIRTMTPKSSAILSLFISSAYAGAEAIILLIASIVALSAAVAAACVSLPVVAGVLAVGAAAGFWGFSVLASIDSDKNSLLYLCKAIRESFSSLDSTLSASQVFEVRKQITLSRSELATSEKCLSDESSWKKLCLQVKDCIATIETDLELMTKSNNTQRSSNKKSNLPAPKTTPSTEKKKAKGE